MTKQFIRTDNEAKIEYSDQRLKAYKKILQLWDHSDSAIALTRVVNALKNGRQNQIPYDDCEDVITDLHKTGLISLVTIKSGFFSSQARIEINDQSFFDNIFYKKDHSDVLKLAKLKLMETKLVDHKEVELTNDIHTPRSICIFGKVIG